jgi:catechol 2,3-dioxygenase-like lactoylglutathione lyase family enzyme
MSFRYDHLHLRSFDAIAAARFYVEVLDAREVRREGTPVSRVVVEVGGITVFIEQALADSGPAAKPPHRGIEHIGFAVDNLDATVADLRRRGVTLVNDIKTIRPGLRIAFIEGPDAVRIEILERKSA